MRWEIGKLRPRPRISLRSHDHRRRGRIEMKQRMDVVAAGYDRDGTPGFKQLRLLHAKVAHPQVRSNRVHIFKRKKGMNARTGKHVKCTGEFVLMDVGRAIQPKENLNVESRIFVNDQFWLTKPRLRLPRLFIIEQETSNQIGEVDVLSGRARLQSSTGDLGEF